MLITFAVVAEILSGAVVESAGISRPNNQVNKRPQRQGQPSKVSPKYPTSKSTSKVHYSFRKDTMHFNKLMRLRYWQTVAMKI